MASVTVKVNGRSYPIICDDGEEDHLLYLAEYVDKKVKDLSEAAGTANEGQLLLMASLLIADDLSQAYETIDGLRDGSKPDAENGQAHLQTIAEQLETIADRLEKA
ncbi:cell division protein ZapA [Sneathiella limimaris]|uniref:cell division protein ZapA n=1 Tax=Sneathiella limimaris TaxID=1964213 RepID=UPI00146D49E8|nr:cell division protein ZapA [Sneathiella limimaris]